MRDAAREYLLENDHRYDFGRRGGPPHRSAHGRYQVALKDERKMAELLSRSGLSILHYKARAALVRAVFEADELDDAEKIID